MAPPRRRRTTSSVTAVEVDRELEHAKIYYTCLDGNDLADDVVEAFAEQRGRVRKAIGVQAKVRRVPNLTFLPDNVLRSAQRIEEILAKMPRLPDAPEPVVTSDDDAGGNFNSLISFTAPAAGTYYFHATGYSLSAAGGYTLTTSAW